MSYDGFNRLTQFGFAGMEEKSVAVGMVAAASPCIISWPANAAMASKSDRLCRWWPHAPRPALHVFSRSGMLV